MPIPPAEPYYTKAPDQVETTWTLDDLKTSVTQAEAAGGWVQLTFHDICDVGCPEPNVSPACSSSSFLGWRRGRRGARSSSGCRTSSVARSPRRCRPGRTEAATGGERRQEPVAGDVRLDNGSGAVLLAAAAGGRTRRPGR